MRFINETKKKFRYLVSRFYFGSLFENKKKLVRHLFFLKYVIHDSLRSDLVNFSFNCDPFRVDKSVMAFSRVTFEGLERIVSI